ncbi:MAG: prepilin-type N-terminal cleavage/methylation domain-containing protein [Desulfobacterales bacterium]|nr:prepilin-type N-terminal cleavage/methylation domain-containing protein [Desulfobacterales bacterium]MBL7205589.1 prepilin-type N-terminal cleavage/methylation domain-containing protein [Desulfobacteraceae bacterium]
MRFSAEKKERGFTLIELLIAMALALVLITSLSSAFISQRKIYAAQEQVSEMIQNARAAMDMISRELKMAGYDPTGSGSFSLPYNSDTSTVDIYADIDGDGSITTSTGSKDHITYSKATGEEIIRRNTNTGGGAQQLAENIQAFTIAYYDSAGNATTTAADIRQIEITITAQTSKPDPNYGQNSGYRRYTLTSRVTPPNLDL